MTERERLPDTRKSITHKFTILNHEGYITVGKYEDGRPGELFIKMSKVGSTTSGLMDTIGILTSLCLQHGVPIEVLASKMENMRFEPIEEGKATSVVDYIFRWIRDQFKKKKDDDAAS